MRAGLPSTSTNRSVSRAVEMFVFWVVLLVFVIIATESAGVWTSFPVGSPGWCRCFPAFSVRCSSSSWAPCMASAVRTAVTAAAASAGFAYAQVVGRMARIGVLLISVIVALDQIGLDVAFLIVLVAVVAGAMLAGAALAFGLGARTSVGNILASHYLVDTFKVGHRIRIGDVEGKILEITPTSVIVEADQGRTVIPASQFSEQVATLLSQ